MLQSFNNKLFSPQMKAKLTNQKRIGKGYSCLPETHAEIERRRIAAGFKSTGKVLEATFKPAKK
jgi:hypothetical protein